MMTAQTHLGPRVLFRRTKSLAATTSSTSCSAMSGISSGRREPNLLHYQVAFPLLGTAAVAPLPCSEVQWYLANYRHDDCCAVGQYLRGATLDGRRT